MARSISGVESVSAKTEKWRGTLTVKILEKKGSDEREQIRDRLKKDGDEILKPAGGFVYISEADEMSSREITVHFTGNDYDTLKKIARNASSRIASAPGIGECLLRFREGRPMYTLNVDRERCAMSGVSHALIAENVRTCLFGPVITKFIENDREVDVRLRYSRRDSIDEIIAGTVRSISGAMLKISELTDLYEGEGPTKNYRLNSRRSVSVTAKTGSTSMQEAELSIKKALSGMNFPEEYSWEFDSSVTEYYESRRSLSVSVILSVLVIYMLLASLFESLSLPLVIMITLPLGLTVPAFLFFIFSIPLSSSVYMGFIVLAGIVVNNGIILADSLHKGIGEKELSEVELERYIMDTALSRFRPVFITVATTVLGMLPLLLSSGDGAALWRPFALTVCAGLAGSTLLTLVLLPLVFYYYYRRDVGRPGSEAITRCIGPLNPPKGDFVQIEYF
jgi:HAE1 family hydrophobic/amphiphilic exporter-1